MGLSVDFTNTSTGQIATFLWDFGDGNYDDVNYDPSHTYAAGGTYNVTLWVFGVYGTYDSNTQPVTVTNIIPVWNSTSQKIAFINTDGYLTTTTDFLSGIPTWVDTFLLPDVGRDRISLCAIDYQSPFYMGTGTEVNCWVVSGKITPTIQPYRIFKIDDVFGAKTVTLQYTGNIGEDTIGDITSKPGVPGAIAIANRLYSSGGHSFNPFRTIVTTDGVNWTDQEFEPPSQDYLSDLLPRALEYDDSDNLFSGFRYIPLGVGAPKGIHESTDGGVSFADAAIYTLVTDCPCLKIPSTSPTDYYYTDGAELVHNGSNITPLVTGVKNRPQHPYSMNISLQDEDVIVFGGNVNTGAATSRPHRSANGGSSWSVVGSTFDNTRPYDACMIAGNDDTITLWMSGRLTPSRIGISNPSVSSGDIIVKGGYARGLAIAVMRGD